MEKSHTRLLLGRALYVIIWGKKCLYRFLRAAWGVCGGVVVVWKIPGKLEKPKMATDCST